MTIRDAARTLGERFGYPEHPHWIQSIGVAEPDGLILMYLVRRPRAHEGEIPSEWEGYRVGSRVIGEVRVGPPR